MLGDRDIPDPGEHPYITEEIFSLMREVKDEKLLNLSKMKTGTWYKVLLENKVIMEATEDGVRKLIPCRAELNNPENDWDTSWKLANMRGLNPAEQEFLWKMLHNLLPTQARLFRLRMKNTPKIVVIFVV